MSIQPTPIRTVEQLARDLIDLQAQTAALTERANQIKAQIADQVAVGQTVHLDGGVAITVREPNRRFNPDKAVKLLAPEVLELCRPDGYDPKKLKSFLSPVLLEQVMDAGTGAAIVSVK